MIAIAPVDRRLPTGVPIWDNEGTTKRALRRVFGDPQQRALTTFLSKQKGA